MVSENFRAAAARIFSHLRFLPLSVGLLTLRETYGGCIELDAALALEAADILAGGGRSAEAATMS